MTDFGHFESFTASPHSFDPSALAAGEELLLYYAKDQRRTAPPVMAGVIQCDALFSSWPALEQDGVIYRGTGFGELSPAYGSWEGVSVSGLDADDFSEWNGAGTPDLTSTGSVVEFGLIRRTENLNPPALFFPCENIDDLDNWMLSVSPGARRAGRGDEDQCVGRWLRRISGDRPPLRKQRDRPRRSRWGRDPRSRGGHARRQRRRPRAGRRVDPLHERRWHGEERGQDQRDPGRIHGDSRCHGQLRQLRGHSRRPRRRRRGRSRGGCTRRRRWR